MDLVNVAHKIKELRLQQQLTIDQLAARSGLSKGYISRLENFRTGASLRALNLVAAALGVEMIDLFRSENASPEYVFGRLDEGEFIDRNQGAEYGIRYFALAYEKTDRNMNPFFLEYRRSDKQRELMQHDSQEFFVLLEGEVDYMIGSADNSRRMVKGDTVYLRPSFPTAPVSLPAVITLRLWSSTTDPGAEAPGGGSGPVTGTASRRAGRKDRGSARGRRESR